MDKTDVLFQMMQAPQEYTEHQLEEILSKKENYELYTLMAKTRSCFALRNVLTDEDVDMEWKRFECEQFRNSSSNRKRFRFAAMFVGVLLFSGIAFSAIHIVKLCIQGYNLKPSAETEIKEVANEDIPLSTVHQETRSKSIVFDNVPLEQIIQDIAEFHGIETDVQNEEVRKLRFYFVWKQDKSLQAVVGQLNCFDRVNIIVENNKLIVK